MASMHRLTARAFLCVLLIALLPALAHSSAHAQADDPQADEPVPERTAAIFVRNRTDDPDLDPKLVVFEDLLTAQLGGDDNFRVISRATVLDAINAAAPGTAPASVEDALSSQASTLQLGRLLNADYLLVANITSYQNNTRALQQHDLDFHIREQSLRASYQIIDAGNDGATLASSSVAVSNASRVRGGQPADVDSILEEAAGKLAENLSRQAQRQQIAQRGNPTNAHATITVNATVENLMVPDIHRDDNEEWAVSGQRLPVSLDNVTVEVNGVVQGSAPGEIQLPTGLNRVRLTRDGFHPWERAVNVHDGMNLSVAMSMTDANRQRMRDTLNYFEQIRHDRALSQAQLERIQSRLDREERLTDVQIQAIQSALGRQDALVDGELDVLHGHAEMLRQSGYRIDVDIESDEAPTIIDQRRRSLWRHLDD